MLESAMHNASAVCNLGKHLDNSRAAADRPEMRLYPAKEMRLVSDLACQPRVARKACIHQGDEGPQILQLALSGSKMPWLVFGGADG